MHLTFHPFFKLEGLTAQLRNPARCSGLVCRPEQDSDESARKASHPCCWSDCINASAMIYRPIVLLCAAVGGASALRVPALRMKAAAMEVSPRSQLAQLADMTTLSIE